MGTDTKQAKMLREAMERLGISRKELAEQLGVSVLTLRNWLSPTTTTVHREMPRTAVLLLERILADGKRKKARGS